MATGIQATRQDFDDLATSGDSRSFAGQICPGCASADHLVSEAHGGSGNSLGKVTFHSRDVPASYDADCGPATIAAGVTANPKGRSGAGSQLQPRGGIFAIARHQDVTGVRVAKGPIENSPTLQESCLLPKASILQDLGRSAKIISR